MEWLIVILTVAFGLPPAIDAAVNLYERRNRVLKKLADHGTVSSPPPFENSLLRVLHRAAPLCIIAFIASGLAAIGLVEVNANVRTQNADYQYAYAKTQLARIPQLENTIRQLESVLTELNKEDATNRETILFLHLKGTNALPENALDLEQAMNAVVDQENSASATIDGIISDLRTISLAMFEDEQHAYSGETYSLVELHAIDQKIQNIAVEQGDCLIALERLRTFANQELVSYYQKQFVDSYKSNQYSFFASIRQRPQIISDVAALAGTLQTNTVATDWNLKAAKTVGDFMQNY